MPAPQANPGDGEAYLAAFTAAIEEVTAAQAALSDVELAIRFGALTGSSDLVARRLVTQDRVICALPEYLRTHGEPQTLVDVRKKRFSPPATHRLSDGEAMVDAAVGGLGLAQLPISLVRGPLANGLLRPVLQAFSAVGVDVHAVWPRQRHLSSQVRYVVDQLVTYASRGRLD